MDFTHLYAMEDYLKFIIKSCYYLDATDNKRENKRLNFHAHFFYRGKQKIKLPRIVFYRIKLKGLNVPVS